MDGKIHARLHRQSVDAFLRHKRCPKTHRSASRLDGPPIWIKPATFNHTNRLIAAAFRTRQNPPPRNRWIPPVLFPIHRLHHHCHVLKHAGRIAKDRLTLHLKTYGNVPCRYIPSLFTHTSQKTSFALFVDDFGVKYTDKSDAQHLLTYLEKLYKCTIYWEGKLYLGMTLNWNNTKRWM